MKSSSLVTGLRIAAIVLTLSAGRALAGFADIHEASGATIPPSDDAIASSDDHDTTPALSFDVGTTSQTPVQKDNQPPHPQVDVRSVPPPVAAPLPVALLPGGLMIAGSFIATRFMKRRIV